MKNQMTKSDDKHLSEKKELIKTAEFQISKKLSTPSWVLIGCIYTVAIVKLTLMSVSNDVPRNYVTEQKLLEVIEQTIEKQNSKRHLPRVSDTVTKGQFHKLKSELLEEINKINNDYLDLIQKEKTTTKLLVKDYIERGPASLTSDEGGKVLPYSIKNKNMLWAQYHQKRKRLEEKLENERIEFLKTVNMTNPVGERAFKEFQDASELKLTELEQEHYEKLRIFEKQQYLIVESE